MRYQLNGAETRVNASQPLTATLPEQGVGALAEFNTSLARRFWAKVDKSQGCWVFTGHRNSRDGYGRIGVGARVWLAHRMAWTLEHGPIPDGLFVLHHCDNPPCVRPDHLFLGNDSDNRWDMVMKGRHPRPNSKKTHCKHGHEFTIENTVISHRVRQRGRIFTERNCKECHRIRQNVINRRNAALRRALVEFSGQNTDH